MTRAELRKKAFEVAAGLIETMDADKFWGTDVCDTHEVAELIICQARVIQFLREKERTFK